MVKVNSARAQKLLKEPRFFLPERASTMQKYPTDKFNLWAALEVSGGIVKSLSLFGNPPTSLFLLLESMASLLVGKKPEILGELSVRECEAFLRDRNSVLALEDLPADDEAELKKIFNWLPRLSGQTRGESYLFSSQKGSFRTLPLVDKVRELKAFLGSREVVALYQEWGMPELLDVDDLTVYVQAPYSSEAERILFSRLHELGVETFREENLNFIPEA